MRTFTWCSQEVAEECQLNKPHTHICITSPDGRMITPKCGATVLNMSFYDLDPEAIRRTDAFSKDPKGGQKFINGCFTEDQAKRMVEFVKTTNEDALIIVNCEAGISRSPGVVVAFRRFNGQETESCFIKAHPNIYVTSMLSRVLRREFEHLA